MPIRALRALRRGSARGTAGRRGRAASFAVALLASSGSAANAAGADPFGIEAQVRSWLGPLFWSVEFDGYRFAPGRLLLAILLFLVILVVARMLRRWLRAGLLNASRMEAGAAHSIDQAIGYAGFALAVLAALSMAGIDISNIALVAGALSVGIGFGLQSVVNNFVSGLILLAERPVKVGDWIEIKGQRGRVSRISVRATEMETADRGRVFVPNADLIANAVTNHTPRDAKGITQVHVSVAQSSDPGRVREVLATVAADCPLLDSAHTPSVTFDAIGANGLDFSIRGTVGDALTAGAAESDLRVRIVQALQRAGIELARPQSDVRLRDLDAVRMILARVMEDRERQARMARQGEAGSAAGGPAGASRGAPPADQTP